MHFTGQKEFTTFAMQLFSLVHTCAVFRGKYYMLIILIYGFRQLLHHPLAFRAAQQTVTDLIIAVLLLAA